MANVFRLLAERAEKQEREIKVKVETGNKPTDNQEGTKG